MPNIFYLILGDYINAAYVDGFTCAKENIITEWPMSHTVGNFWAMVYDFDITAIVVLHPTLNSKAPLHKKNFGIYLWIRKFSLFISFSIKSSPV